MALIEEIEEAWDGDWLAETDKAWDAIHRSLNEGRLEYGDTLAHKCILGETNLHGADDYIIAPLTAVEVRALASYLVTIDEPTLRIGYNKIDGADYPELSDEDFSYTWSYFVGLRELFRRAADNQRAMIFTVDQ